MKVLAVNASPRKTGNTAALLKHALEGAASQGADTELIHLYDLKFKGCASCFACKLKNGKSYGKCAVKDELTPLLEQMHTAHAVVFGSPIYLMSTTGCMRAFMERLIFPYITYKGNYDCLFNRQVPAAMVYTMNIAAEQIEPMGLRPVLDLHNNFLRRIFGSVESLEVTDTYQFDDYGKYEVTVFDERKKAETRANQFPADCQKAFDLGAQLARS